jgi:hypothetical protein
MLIEIMIQTMMYPDSNQYYYYFRRYASIHKVVPYDFASCPQRNRKADNFKSRRKLLATWYFSSHCTHIRYSR